MKVSEICVAHSSREVALNKTTVGAGSVGLRPPERKWNLEDEGFSAAMVGGRGGEWGGVSLFQELAAAKPRPDLISSQEKKPSPVFCIWTERTLQTQV